VIERSESKFSFHFQNADDVFKKSKNLPAKNPDSSYDVDHGKKYIRHLQPDIYNYRVIVSLHDYSEWV